MSRNADLYARAQALMPGGVNSPVRAFRSVGGAPRFFARGEGAYVWDADGRRYIDYVGSWGPIQSRNLGGRASAPCGDQGSNLGL